MSPCRFEYGVVEDTEDIAAFGRVLAECFPMSFTPEAKKEWPWFENPDHFRLLRCGGPLAAGLVAVPVGQWFGGRPVPMWAIRLVGVGLDFRGRGAAPALMGAMLREAREQGAALSTLYPATQPLYRSVGYEQAGVNQLLAMPTNAARVRDHTLELRRVDPDLGTDELEQVYEQRARATAGHVQRSDWFWKRIVHPRNQPQTQTFMVDGADGAEGYVVYSMPPTSSENMGYDVMIQDFVANTAGAARRLVTHLGEHHSLGQNIYLRGAPESAAFFCLPQQSLKIEESIWWMLRIVDVRGALEGRGYHSQVSGRVQFEIHDELLTDNSGRWTLNVEAGVPHVEPGGDGSLRCDIRGLAALYSGQLTPYDLCLSGLAEASEEARSAASLLFAAPRPWTSDFF